MGQVVGFHKRPESVNSISERVLPTMVLPGFRMFVAYALSPHNERSYVAEILIRSSPRYRGLPDGCAPMITYRSVRDGKVSGFEGEMSIRDCGIIQNPYNMHCTFLTREAAEAYLRRIEAQQFTHFEKRKWDALNARRSFTIKGTKGKK